MLRKNKRKRKRLDCILCINSVFVNFLWSDEELQCRYKMSIRVVPFHILTIHFSCSTPQQKNYDNRLPSPSAPNYIYIVYRSGFDTAPNRFRFFLLYSYISLQSTWEPIYIKYNLAFKLFVYFLVIFSLATMMYHTSSVLFARATNVLYI